jgi:DNA-binding response OmpR family regulator
MEPKRTSEQRVDVNHGAGRMSAGTAALDEILQPRILIVEDEAILALLLEEFLVDAGFEIAGVAGRLETALALIKQGQFDAAILDANLAGVSSGPAASALTAGGVPFIVVSGYLPEQQPGAFSGAVCLQKPCRPDDLIQTLRAILRIQ